MKKLVLLFSLVIVIVACKTKESLNENLITDGPIQLNPENQHYFLHKGKALALITSGEHYGSVINPDFDYRTYLKTLSAEGMNYTRIFSGSYFGIDGISFGIKHSTLAPKIDKIITPWSKVDFLGEKKYDLSKWNKTYFSRLKDFMTVAAENNIIVELTLFSSFYNDSHWNICPQNPQNNINITDKVTRFESLTLNNGKLLDYQIMFVKKMVRELNEFDNFFFEIQNEPWADHSLSVYNIINKDSVSTTNWIYRADFADEESMAWQEKIASVIVKEENHLPQQHMIAQNYVNFKAPIPIVGKDISIINFHYAWPEAVEWNYHYNKVIGFDESGFAGSGDQVYRRQAWQFILSGGGLFNSLDYSFFVGHEDGLGKNTAPGGGSKKLRLQLKILSDFLLSFDLTKLYPNNFCIKSSPGLIPYILSDKNNSYAIFLNAIGTIHTSLQIKTGKGTFQVKELNTITGKYTKPIDIKSVNGIINLDLEIPDGELAIKITKI